MFRSLVFGAVGAVALLSSANAADIYVPSAPGGYKDAYIPVPNWAGFYIGVSGGYDWGKTTAIDQLATNGSPWNKLGDTFHADADGGTVGGTFGYNWQRANFVFGLEGDVGWLGGSGTGTSSISSDTHVKSDGGLFVTARARLGYALGTTLVYGTGGYFGADLHSKVFDNIGATLNTSDAGFQSGWTAGGGIEHMLSPAWSIKAEYLHFDLGRDRVGGPCCGGGTQFFDIENSGNIFRVGANYHFHNDYVPLK